MDMTEVERLLLGLDDEIHDLLRYISISKERDIEVELENYEDVKETISMDLKEPLDPTAEIGRMREKRYLVQWWNLTIDSDVLVYAFVKPTKKIYKEQFEEFAALHDKADRIYKSVIRGDHELVIP